MHDLGLVGTAEHQMQQMELVSEWMARLDMGGETTKWSSYVNFTLD